METQTRVVQVAAELDHFVGESQYKKTGVTSLF